MPDIPQQLFTEQLWRHEHVALKALHVGDATPDQQKLALEIIVKKLSRTHDLSYIPSSFDGSAFLSGRAFVGHQLLKYLNLPASKSPEVQDDG